MRPIRLKLAPTAQSATSIAASQAPGSSKLTLTALAAGPIDPQTGTQFGLGRILGITSGGNDTGITFAIVGVDQNGVAVSENVTGASGGVAVSTKYYTSVTSITPSGSVASTASVGTVNTTASAALATIPLNLYSRIGATVQVDVSGTISYTVQMTYDDCIGSGSNNSTNTYFATPASPTALTAQSAAKYTQLPPGVCGISVTIPTYSTNGYVVVNVITPSNCSVG